MSHDLTLTKLTLDGHQVREVSAGALGLLLDLHGGPSTSRARVEISSPSRALVDAIIDAGLADRLLLAEPAS